MRPTILITLLITLLTLKSFSTENNTTDESNSTQEFNQTKENPLEENLTEVTLIDDTIMEVNTDNCVGCHGLNFEKPAMGMSNIVTEMTKEYIEATLFNYKYNSVEGTMNPLMSWQTAQLSDDEIRAIAQQIGK